MPSVSEKLSNLTSWPAGQLLVQLASILVADIVTRTLKEFAGAVADKLLVIQVAGSVSTRCLGRSSVAELSVTSLELRKSIWNLVCVGEGIAPEGESAYSVSMLPE
jgi:hypothetical protein